MACELEKICEVLDKLTLDALTLMEQHVQHKLEVEQWMCDGETQLAKSRYIMRRNSVSALQLPSENGPDVTASALVRTEADDNLYTDEAFDLDVARKQEEASNPMRWFGVLVPLNLHSAQAKFKQALYWVVKAANTQNQLRAVCLKIAQLEEFKKHIVTQ